ncbi:ornithine--oxo-acid transaminase [Aureibacillus halotolerans]|uniref:Ornithine aminotransferase n=1 Tax=Aureibacillus halotolerans TaxID=1508390 RepID=A0A4R6U7J3_9BACI|nr:ornithine--oxo-acid transaminase [Aureibacillus halotolerans]TDQ40883.1 ornithine--oxo-acid transaminase [Aureibacillus halotolerans]
MRQTDAVIRETTQWSAANYHPLPIVIEKGEGAWVWDAEGRRYLDMLSGYSALNQGHRHPAIVSALIAQAQTLTLTSRAFYTSSFAQFAKRLHELTGKDMVLPMNTGAEAVETAIKAARRWAYQIKGVPENKAEIIVCDGNFHGRTLTVTSFSTEESYKRGFGPFTPGFVTVPFGNAEAIKKAVTANTAAVLLEPIQGEAGIRIPPDSYLQQVRTLCDRHGILFMADEIQTGFGRTGQRFACDWEKVVPDVYILGKALGGGMYPVSAVVANKDVLGVFEPGSHGSTFGGNPLAAAVGVASLQVIENEHLAERSRLLGEHLKTRLASIQHPVIKEVRGRGLFVAIELFEDARPYCEKLMHLGLLCKETHATVIRLAPPLVIKKVDLDWAIEQIEAVFTAKSFLKGEEEE